MYFDFLAMMYNVLHFSDPANNNSYKVTTISLNVKSQSQCGHRDL